ncbi:hypothetical protein Asp14428_24570 [Actinoplanes sp. NBRC 14428]|nr:hypothetical protein Asp14428_24570 [Actinoplanes sp. NBRC 14428]
MACGAVLKAARRWGYLASQSRIVGVSSGPGMPSGAGEWWSRPSSTTWNEADMKKMVLPCCWAVERRTEKERPSRMVSTVKSIGTVGSPGRTK